MEAETDRLVYELYGLVKEEKTIKIRSIEADFNRLMFEEA